MEVNPLFFFVSPFFLFFFFLHKKVRKMSRLKEQVLTTVTLQCNLPIKKRAQNIRVHADACMYVLYVNEVRAHAHEFALTRYVYAHTCRNVRPHGSPAHTSGETCERREAGAPRAIGHLTSMAVPLFLTNTNVQQQRYHDLRRCLHV